MSLEDHLGDAIADYVATVVDAHRERLGGEAAALELDARRLAHLATMLLVARTNGDNVDVAERAVASAWSSLRARTDVTIRRHIRGAISDAMLTAVSAVLHGLRQID